MSEELQAILAALLVVAFFWFFLNSEGVFSNMRILMQ